MKNCLSKLNFSNQIFIFYNFFDLNLIMKLNKLILIFPVVKIKFQIKYLFSSDFYSIKLNNIISELNYILTIEKLFLKRF